MAPYNVSMALMDIQTLQNDISISNWPSVMDQNAANNPLHSTPRLFFTGKITTIKASGYDFHLYAGVESDFKPEMGFQQRKDFLLCGQSAMMDGYRQGRPVDEP